MRWLGLFGAALLGCSGQDSSGDSEDSPGVSGESKWDTAAALQGDPGRVVLHRLNGDELERSLQALLVSELPVKDKLPADGMAHGFDNNAQAQTLSSLHLETIESAVDSLLQDALRPPVTIDTMRLYPWSDSWSGNGAMCQINSYPFDEGVGLWYTGTHAGSLRVEHSGTYTFRAEVCQAYNDNLPVLAVLLNGEEVLRFDVETVCKDSGVIEAELELEEGLHDLLLSKPDDEKFVCVNWLEFEGPLEADGSLPPGRAKLYGCDPEPVTAPSDSGLEESAEADLACAQDIVEDFVTEAWRRPVDSDELDSVMAIFDQAYAGSQDVHDAIYYAMKRTLLSPWFLFRVELPIRPDEAQSARLNPHELAVRLSYFLWSRHPDAELTALADDGTLVEDEVLTEQVRRMLADDRADALIDNFAEQWLGVRSLEGAAPDSGSYPDFDDSLRASMGEEMLALARRSLMDGRSMMELLTATETWVDERLGLHYGVPVDEPGWVAVPDRSGSGLLTTGGFLTGTSTPTRSSPVRRGYWVVTHLLCEEPPPPPDGVEQEFDESGESGSVQEQLESHRADPACAVCHDQLDPIGLALENFDGVGAWRDTYSDGADIEPSGTLPGVGSFSNVSELASGLADDPRVERCMMQKAFTYGLGRATKAHDWPYLKEVEAQFRESGHRFATLVEALVLSEPFRSHRGEEP